MCMCKQSITQVYKPQKEIPMLYFSKYSEQDYRTRLLRFIDSHTNRNQFVGSTSRYCKARNFREDVIFAIFAILTN